jgi:hypothetical protein
MKRWTRICLASVLALAPAGTFARAQNTYPYLPPQFGPGYQTPLSPYLNFLRGGDPAANYFLGVLPEFQRRQDRNQFRVQIGNLQGLTAPLRLNPLGEFDVADIPRTLSATGHPAGFGYTGPYFAGSPGGMMGPRPGAPQARQFQPLGQRK